MKHLLILLLACFSITAFAEKDRGGGDLCENRIKVISEDLMAWIYKGGPKNLTLPIGITPDFYSSTMISQINKAQIICVTEGDAGYPVQVDGRPKVCRFDRSSNEHKITCDIRKFQAFSEAEQYVLIHHEYAGLAEIESPNGATSQYNISNQISGFLEDHIVKKLVVKPNSTQGNNPNENLFNTLKQRFEASSKPFDISKIIHTGEGQKPYFTGCTSVDSNFEMMKTSPQIAVRLSYVRTPEGGPLNPEVRDYRIVLLDRPSFGSSVDYGLQKYFYAGAKFYKDGSLNADLMSEYNASIQCENDGTTKKEVMLNSSQKLSPDKKTFTFYGRCNSSPTEIYTEMRQSGEYLISRYTYSQEGKPYWYYTYCWK